MVYYNGFRAILIILPLSLALPACGGDGDTAPLQPDACEESAAKYQELVDDVRATVESKGAQLAVSTSECGIVVRASGQSTDAEPLTESQVLRVGSLTKTFVAATTLDLVQKGELTLEATIDTYAFASTFPKASEITIRHLLDHTSGLPGYTSATAFVDAYKNNPGKVWATQDLVGLAVEVANEAETDMDPTNDIIPGTTWHYSNTNYLLLGRIIEDVTGDKLSAAIRARMIDEAKLDNTTFDGEEEIKGDLAHGYDMTGNDVTTKYHPSGAWAAGAMVSNVKDLVIWAEQLYTQSLIEPALRSDMLTATKVSNDLAEGLGYGLGAFIFKAPIASKTVVGHSGDFDGYHAIMFHVDGEDVTFAVIINQDIREPNENFHTLEQAALNKVIAVVAP